MLVCVTALIDVPAIPTNARLIFEAEVTEKTFYTALKKFDERGDVIVHVATGSCGQNEYTVVLNDLKDVRTDTARKRRNRNKDRHRPGYWKDRWQKIKQPLDA